jgi:hypothetical protein
MRSSFFVLLSLMVTFGIAALLGEQAQAQVADAGTGVSSIVDLLPSAPTERTFFRMADGRWYDPRSGYSAATERALRDLINPPAIVASASEVVAVPVPPPPVFFQMADGRWYDPRSGLSAASEQALRDLINPPTPSLGVASAPLQEFPLVQAIRRGQAMLREQLVQSDQLLATKPDWAPVVLAVWRSATNQIDLINIEKRGTEVRGTDPRISEADVLLSRQLQSQYKLASDSDVVVAIRYPLYREVTVAKKTKYQREDVVYSPYSPMLNTEEMVRFGHAWLDAEFQRIADDLRARGVRSRFDPSKSLADMLSPEVARAILVIEHTDETSLERDAAATYAKMLVTVAANATTSYAYSDSHVGAQGFAQFMPSTYTLVAKDKALGLPAEVQAGTRSFETAIKAQLVYLDRLWSVMPETAKSLLSTNPDRAAEFVVAAYNGGEGRIQKASAVWGEEWATPDKAELKKAQAKVNAASAEVKKAKKAVTAAKAGVAKTQANAALKKANTALANAQAVLNKMESGTLRDETIGYVAKFKNALKGIRLVKASIEGSRTVNMASAPTNTTTTTF